MTVVTRAAAVVVIAGALGACAPHQKDAAPAAFQRSVIVHCSLTRDVEGYPCLAKARQACGSDRVRLKNVDSREEVRAPVKPNNAPMALVYNYSVVYYCEDAPAN